TMTNFILASLCTFSFISVSVCQFHTVSVRPAEDVTLMCSNFSKFFSHVFWFKMNSSPNASRISAMLSAESNVSLSDGFHFSKYNMTSNITNLFLKIKEVNFSDSGLYFCGQYVTAGEAPVPAVFTATHLQVEDVSDRLLNLPRMILGCVAVFLTVVIVALVVKIRTIQNGFYSFISNLDPDGLNYEVLHIRPKAKNKRRPADEKNLKDNVLYAATR
uniref:Immunoglobulin domain-containing protein n=1 Tax=Poecilia reticulata TaxID=8081 RepID=A0A3P9N1F1_POERE